MINVLKWYQLFFISCFISQKIGSCPFQTRKWSVKKYVADNVDTLWNQHCFMHYILLDEIMIYHKNMRILTSEWI